MVYIGFRVYRLADLRSGVSGFRVSGSGFRVCDGQ